MSLMKPRVMTPARIAASRGNAQKSTGPRTARGKAQSSLNCLRHGSRSPAYHRLWMALLEAFPGDSVARTVLANATPQQIDHPVYHDIISVHLEMEREDQAYARRIRKLLARRESERSREVIENNDSAKTRFLLPQHLTEN